MNQLAKSEIVISRILSRLMDWGIQECQLEFSELELDPREYGSFFFPCIDWLTAEGVIRTGKIHRTMDSSYSGIVVRPVLTSFGLKHLDQKIFFDNEEQSFAEKIRHVSDSGTNYSGFGDLIGGVLGGFTKSIGS